MNILEIVRNWTPSKNSAGFLWHAGGWFVIGLIVSNTLLALYAASVQLQVLSLSSADSSSLRSISRALEGEAGTTLAERRQLLSAAKLYVISQGAPDVDFTLVFIKRIGQWVLLEVIPATEGIPVMRLLMEKLPERNGAWVGRAMGEAIGYWSDSVPQGLLN